MNYKKNLFFDVDGTIFSADKILFECYVEALKRFREQTNLDVDIPSKDFLISQIGKPSSETAKKILPKLNEQQRVQFSQFSLKELCDSIEKGGGFFYEGIDSVIFNLKKDGYRLFVCSNGRKKYLETILKRGNMLSCFEEILTLDDIQKAQKEELLKFYLEKNQISYKDSIMIGDRDVDQIAASKNNISFIFCSYGHAPENEVSKFDLMINDCTEILQAVRKIYM